MSACIGCVACVRLNRCLRGCQKNILTFPGMSTVIRSDIYNHCSTCYIKCKNITFPPGIFVAYVCNTCTGCSRATAELGPASVAAVSMTTCASISSRCVLGDVQPVSATGCESRHPTCGVSLGLVGTTKLGPTPTVAVSTPGVGVVSLSFSFAAISALPSV
jgi:hypothetical protein